MRQGPWGAGGQARCLAGDNANVLSPMVSRTLSFQLITVTSTDCIAVRKFVCACISPHSRSYLIAAFGPPPPCPPPPSPARSLTYNRSLPFYSPAPLSLVPWLPPPALSPFPDTSSITFP